VNGGKFKSVNFITLEKQISEMIVVPKNIS